MMYQNKFVVAIKAGGKVLRESGNSVYIPFGSEYSVFLKNLGSLRALASVSIDGQDVTDGTKLILQPNGSLDLERYIRSGNFQKGNRFKFIERTAAIEQHRGIQTDDGLVRVEFWAEKPKPISVPVVHYYDQWVPYYHYYDPWLYRYRRLGDWTFDKTIVGTAGYSVVYTSGGGQHLNSNGIIRSCSVSNSPETERGYHSQVQSFNDNGITVAGSESNQQFSTGSWFDTEAQSEVIVLKLRGEVAGKAVSQPLTVERKSKCSTCGQTNKSSSKFCSQCGTATQII